MRALLTTLGSRGDVQPIVALARALFQAGHQVRLAASSDARSMVEAHDIAFVDVGVDIRAVVTAHSEILRGDAARVMPLIPQSIDRQFAVLQEHAAWAEVITGSGLIAAAASVAEAARRPYRYIALCAQAIPSRLHPPYLSKHPSTPRWLNLPLWKLTDWGVNHLVGEHLNRNRRRLGLPATRSPSRTQTPPGKLILAADPELSPPPVDYDPAITVTGPFHLFQDAPLATDLERFLAEGPPPIYVGFGSMPDEDPAETTRMVVAAVAGAGARAVIAGGWASLGQAGLPPSCHGIGEVPHHLLFPRLAGVVHHGGAGTTATAAYCGVPQLIVPHLADQYYWGQHVYALGLGPRPIPRSQLTGQGLKGAIKELLSDERARDAAQAYRSRLQKKADGVRGGVAALERAAGHSTSGPR